MDAPSYREKMYMYHMTTGLPISIYSDTAKLIHQIGIPEIPFSFLDVFPIKSFIKEKSKIFYNHQTDYEEHFISLRIATPKENDFIIVVGPFKYKMLTNNQLRIVSEKARIGKYKMVALQKYYYSLPLAKIGSINQHYKYLESLFESTTVIFNDFDKELMDSELLEKNMIEYREIDFYHHNYLAEKRLVNRLFKGRISPYDDQEIINIEPGTIANDYVRNKKNLSIISIGLFERYAIEQGLDPHISFTIGDAYLRTIEESKNLSDVDIIMQAAFRKYQKALDLVRDSKYSKIINEAIRYIDRHLSLKISLDDVAKHVSVHPSYLSKLIKKELGMSFTDYVLQEKIKEAKMLLRYSNHSLSDIAGILHFSSKSYFVKCFKKVEGVTPGEYVNQKN